MKRVNSVIKRSEAAALVAAQKLQNDAAQRAYDWQEVAPIWLKVAEEEAEFRTEVQRGQHDKMLEELGDWLFALVNLARHYQLDAEEALSLANDKFIRRFNRMQELAEARGQAFSSLCSEAQEALWQEVKGEGL